jgi:hypothetical protein
MAVGNATQAEVLLRQAEEILQRMGAAQVAGISAELKALAGVRPSTRGL